MLKESENKGYITYAEDHGVSESKAKEYWEKASKEVKEETGKTKEELTDSDWQHIMGIFKKIIGNSNKNESITESTKDIEKGYAKAEDLLKKGKTIAKIDTYLTDIGYDFNEVENILNKLKSDYGIKETEKSRTINITKDYIIENYRIKSGTKIIESEEDNMIHKFEQAGLGHAPFKLIHIQALPSKSTLEHNPAAYEMQMNSLIKSSDGSVGGTCDYCGMPIMECYLIKSKDGNTFWVGSECVRKTGDAGLIKVADKLKNELLKDKRHSKEEFEHQELKDLLNDPENQEYFDSLPHPKGFSNMTYMDYIEWMYDHSGASGRGKLLKTIKEVLKGK